MKATSTLVFVESVFMQTTKVLETYFWFKLGNICVQYCFYSFTHTMQYLKTC